MTEAPRWVPIATYGAVYEAELAAGILEDAGIPAHVRGEAGIFGAAWSGTVTRGADVLVPEELADDARDLLARE